MRLRHYKTNLFLTFVMGVASLVAHDARITVSSGVDKSRITIGDLITYAITVTHDEDVRIEMPGLGANLGGFEIRDYEVHDPAKEDGKRVSSVDYVISTFMTGEYEIPSLTISYFLPGDSTGLALTTESIQIMVESVKPSEEGDIRDIKPPMEIPRKLWQTLRWFVLGGFFLLLGILAVIAYRRKKAGKSLLPVKETPSRPPHEIAVERLDALKASDLLERGEIKAYYIEVSEIIRQYVEGRYFIVAMEMTTAEVLEQLVDVDVSEFDYALFQTFLERCDLVKFAKTIPGAEENRLILDDAYGIVERTQVIFESFEENPENSEDSVETETVTELQGVAQETVSATQDTLD